MHASTNPKNGIMRLTCRVRAAPKSPLIGLRAVALPGAVAQIAVATALGAGVAYLWGWPFASGLVFGLALSVASTVVLLRALEARGSLGSSDGRIAVGWLVVEDLVMVLVLVLGVRLRVLPAEGYGLILAGALLSITLNPLAFYVASRLRETALQPATADPGT